MATEFVSSVVALVEDVVHLVEPEQVEDPVVVGVGHSAAVVAELADGESLAEADDVEQSHAVVVVVEHNVAVGLGDADHNVVAVEAVAAECIGAAVEEEGLVVAVVVAAAAVVVVQDESLNIVVVASVAVVEVFASPDTPLVPAEEVAFVVDVVAAAAIKHNISQKQKQKIRANALANKNQSFSVKLSIPVAVEEFAFLDTLVLVAEFVVEPHIEPVELEPGLQVQYIQELGTDYRPFYSGGGSASGLMALLNYRYHFFPEKNHIYTFTITNLKYEL